MTTLRLFGYSIRLVVVLPVYVVVAFGGLGLQAVGRWLLNRSDGIYAVAGARGARRLLDEIGRA